MTVMRASCERAVDEKARDAAVAGVRKAAGRRRNDMLVRDWYAGCELGFGGVLVGVDVLMAVVGSFASRSCNGDLPEISDAERRVARAKTVIKSCYACYFGLC
jgi:hypothetical protein